MSFLIYEEQAGDKLKLVAEVDELETAEEAVDALVDSDAKFGGREFVVFASEGMTVVEAGQPIVRSKPKGGARTAPKPKPATTPAKAAPKARQKRPTQAAKKVPAKSTAAAKKTTARKPAAKKPAAKKPAARKPAARKPAPKAKPKVGGIPKGRASGFKRNPASDE